MGSFAQLTVGGYPIHSTKNYYHRWFFRKTDRVVRTCKKLDRNPLIWSAPDPDTADQEETHYLYTAKAPVLRRRLELAGFHRETLEVEFKRCIADRIRRLEELCSYGEDWTKGYEPRLALLKAHTTIDEWLIALKFLIDTNCPSWEWEDLRGQTSNPVIDLLVQADGISDEFPPLHDTSFPCSTVESMAIAVMEVMPPDVDCVLDITDLIDGGWTNSFEDLLEYHQDHTTFYDVFSTAVTDTKSLMLLAPENKTLARLLYAHVITAMETYLSDTVKKQVLTRESIRRRFVQTNEAFKEKIVVQEIFRKLEGLNEEIVQTIDTMSFHNLDKAIGLYKSVLDTQFPTATIGELKKAVERRHDIVHRNGKTTKGKVVDVAMGDVAKLTEMVDTTILCIDKQVKDGLLDDNEIGQ